MKVERQSPRRRKKNTDATASVVAIGQRDERVSEVDAGRLAAGPEAEQVWNAAMGSRRRLWRKTNSSR